MVLYCSSFILTIYENRNERFQHSAITSSYMRTHNNHDKKKTNQHQIEENKIGGCFKHSTNLQYGKNIRIIIWSKKHQKGHRTLQMFHSHENKTSLEIVISQNSPLIILSSPGIFIFTIYSQEAELLLPLPISICSRPHSLPYLQLSHLCKPIPNTKLAENK